MLDDDGIFIYGRCICNHNESDHGVEKAPGFITTECTVEDCDCIAYEEDSELFI